MGDNAVSRPSAALAGLRGIVLGLVALLLVSWSGWSSRARADPDLQTVLANVRANESLYTDLDTSYSRQYNLAPGKSKAVAGSKSAIPMATVTTYRSVTQEGMYRTESTQKSTAFDGKVTTRAYKRAYDGETTRVLDGGVANIHKGRAGELNVFRPHTFILAKAFVNFPLSLWLEGGPQLSGHEYAGPYRRVSQKTSIEAEEQISGTTCIKLRAESRNSSGDLITIRFIWLAPDRNYLPVKTVAILPTYNKTVPIEVGECSDFRGVKPGIWLPFRCSITTYDEISVRETGKQVVSNTEEWSVKEAVLDPKHDIAFFRNVEIPKSTVVYEVVNGEITSGRVEGREDPPSVQPPPKKWPILWIIVATGLIIIAAIFWCVRFRKRSSRGSDEVKPTTMA